MRFYKNSLINILVLLLCVASSNGQSVPDNRLSLARKLQAAGSYQQALELYLGLYRQGNESYAVINGIQSVYENQQRYPELIDFFQDLIKKYPLRINYAIALGRAYFLSDQRERAEEIWNGVIERDPSNPTHYRLLGNTLTALRAYDQAVALYEKAIKNCKNQQSLYRDLGMLYRVQLDYENAVRSYMKYYAHYKKQFNYIRSQIIAMTRDEEAVKRILGVFDGIDKRLKNDPKLRSLQADLYIKNKQYDKAFAIYSGLYRESKKREYLLSFAAEANANRAWLYAIKSFDLLLRTKMDASIRNNLLYRQAESHYLYGRHLAANGRPEQAQAEVQRALELLDTVHRGAVNAIVKWNSMELSADIHLNFYGDLDTARNLYKEVASQAGAKLSRDRVRLKLGRVYLLKNDLEHSRRILETVQNKKYKKIADYELAELLYFQGQFSMARSAFEQLINQSAAGDSLYNNIMDRLMFIEQFVGDSLHLAEYSQAELLLKRQKKSEAAEQFRRLALGSGPLSAPAAEQAGTIFFQLNKLPQARSLFRHLIDNYSDYPERDRAFFYLARIDEQDKKIESAIENYKKIMIEFPGSFYLNQARERARRLTALIQEEQIQ